MGIANWFGGIVLATTVAGASAEVIGGADVSALPDIERDGGRFIDGGQSGDAIAILRHQGCRVFRVRLFVDPDPVPRHNYGATQGLPYVRDLAKRIKAAGGEVMLDLHYSDTWADPEHQAKPKAWAGDDFDALEKRVGDYTAGVLRDLKAEGVMPEYVQVGNEITAGVLWPDGKVDYAKTPAADATWRRLARLLAAGATAVRRADPKARILLHVHGGGRAGVAANFFERLSAAGNVPVDFDVIGLSFYPAWTDDLATLGRVMDDSATKYGKDVFVAETAYPWATLTDIKAKATMRWPQTPQGQADFLKDLRKTLAAVPGGRGIGFAWWYPESVRVKGRDIWRDGKEALWDDAGQGLPALKEFGT